MIHLKRSRFGRGRNLSSIEVYTWDDRVAKGTRRIAAKGVIYRYE